MKKRTVFEIRSMDFINCDLNDVNFSGANLTGTNFLGTNLKGADTTGAVIPAWPYFYTTIKLYFYKNMLKNAGIVQRPWQITNSHDESDSDIRKFNERDIIGWQTGNNLTELFFKAWLSGEISGVVFWQNTIFLDSSRIFGQCGKRNLPSPPLTIQFRKLENSTASNCVLFN